MEYPLAHQVRKAKEGDEEAKQKLITALEPLIYKMMMHIPKDSRDRQELYQQSALIILEAISLYKEETGVPFAAFIKRQLQYWYWEQYRRYKYTLSLDGGWEEGKSPLDTMKSEEIQPESAVLQTEEATALQKAMGYMTQKQQMAVIDYYCGGKSLSQVADRLGCSYRVAVKHKEAGLRKLKEYFRCQEVV